MESNIPYLLRKLVFGASEGLLYPSGIGEKIFLLNFECYDLANGEESGCKIWWICTLIS
jgi:hypothetical protein